MKRNYTKRSVYVSPIITLFVVEVEAGLAAGSVANGEFLFQGTNSVTPEMEDWTDNTSNTGSFSQEKWF